LNNQPVKSENMKRMILLLVLPALFMTKSLASDYEKTMETTLEKMYRSTSPEELTGIANQFSRIAQAEADQWLPSYYAAFSYVRATYFGEMEAGEIHKYLDKAQNELTKVATTHSGESEIHALQAHIYQLRITDMSSGMKFSSLASESLAVAEQLNPDNPRVFYLKGMNIFHTPEAFGGGAEKAKPFLEKAAGIFATLAPENNLMPSWGAEHNAEMLSLCNSNE